MDECAYFNKNQYHLLSPDQKQIFAYKILTTNNETLEDTHIASYFQWFPIYSLVPKSDDI